jgi:hypothetical protein
LEQGKGPKRELARTLGEVKRDTEVQIVIPMQKRIRLTDGNVTEELRKCDCQRRKRKRRLRISETVSNPLTTE